MAAASSYSAARDSAATAFPDTFANAGEAFTAQGSGDPSAVTSPTPIVTIAGFGPAAETPAGGNAINTRQVIPAVAGRVIEVTAEAQLSVLAGGATVTVRPTITSLGGSYTASIGTAAGPSSTFGAVGDILTVTRRFSNVAPAGGTAWIGAPVWLRMGVQAQGSAGSTVRVRRLTVRDVTALVAAEVQATAAASSASAAATSATAAGTSASASQTSATNAATSAGAASTSATNASNSATSAAGSASTATTQATNAANSATAAGGSATAAAGSASTASTQATNAGNSATAAQASRVAAESARDAALGSATAAASSASAAATSATAAGTSASAANTSATNAATSAGAASTSATNASNSATSAAGSASTATTQATNAANSATAAGGSATAAAGSASTASTQATNAGNSATAAAASAVSAASSYNAARDAAATAFPETFTNNGEAFTNAVGGAPASVAAASPIVTIAGFGPANAIAAGGSDTATRQVLAATAGRVIEVTVEAQLAALNAGDTVTIRAALTGLDGSYASLGTATGPTSAFGAVGSIVTVTRRFSNVAPSGGTAWTASSVWLRAGGKAQGSALSTVHIRRVTVRDVTALAAVETSAAAAATSASSASTSATAAGTSATAASTSATNASTSAGAASTSASNAATSATNASNSATTASGHAANASTSATAAAGSATSAGNSATAAAGSATTASTQATNAGNSATAASASATAAASSYNAARDAAANTFPDTFANSGEAFTAQGGGAPSAVVSISPIVTIAGFGPAAEMAANGSVANTRQVIAAVAGRIIEVTAEVQLSVLAGGATVTVRPIITSLDGSYAASIGTAGGPTSAFGAVGDILTVTRRFSNAAPSGGTAWIGSPAWLRMGVQAQGSATSTVRVRRITVRDVTSQAAAETSATAANTSASTATTQAGLAGTSATAAAASATTASTQAGNASTSATAAATSAANASTSAASASASATIAASVGHRALNENGGFDSYPTTPGVPSAFSLWLGSSSALSRVSDGSGGYSVNMTAAAAAELGIYYYTAAGTFTPSTYYVTEIEAELISGAWTGSGLFGDLRNSAITVSYLNNYVTLATAPDASGVTSASKMGRRSWSVLWQTPSDAAISRYLMFLAAHSTLQGSVAAANQIVFHKLIVRAATAQEVAAGVALPALSASVTTLQTASADLYGRTYARWAIGAAVPGATAFIEARAETTPGAAPTSSVAIGARQFAVYNPSGAAWLKALDIQNGSVILSGGLQAGAFIRLGTGAGWPVALRAVDFTAGDGEVVDFGTDLGSLPSLTLSTLNLAPLAAGESYDVRASSLTATGFTMVAKINVPGTPTAFNKTVDTASTAFGSGGRKIDKTADANSTDGNYRITATGTNEHTFYGEAIGGQLQEDTYQDVYSDIEVWAYKGSAWSLITTIPTYTTIDRRTGILTLQTVAVGWSVDDTVQLGDGVKEVGLRHSLTNTYNTMSDFSNLRWTAPGSASGVRSATPSGQKVVVTVRPQ
ncbi:MAG: DUF1983 domain-containing protein [Thermoleophilia bacterium]|nr:DUF1983 domain-containing protein [Thermoleophilia bacterium]